MQASWVRFSVSAYSGRTHDRTHEEPTSRPTKPLYSVGRLFCRPWVGRGLRACVRPGTTLSLRTAIRRRRALAARLIVMQNMGYFLDELGVLLRAFRRAPKEVALFTDRSLHVTAASLNLKRSSLGVKRRRFFFCLLHGSQSPAPTPTSPHPSSTGPSGKQSSFRACSSHANPASPSSTPSWAPDRVMASMLRKAGMRLQPRKEKKCRSTRRQRAKACVPQSRCCTVAEAPGKSTESR